MHSDKTKRFLKDILDNIGRIEDYTGGMSLAEFQKNQLVMDAVERCFQRLTEASIQLGPDGDTLLPMHDRRAIRKFGNLLRHHYRYVQADSLWEFIELDLPSLKRDTAAALADLSNRPASDD